MKKRNPSPSSSSTTARAVTSAKASKPAVLSFGIEPLPPRRREAPPVVADAVPVQPQPVTVDQEPTTEALRRALEAARMARACWFQALQHARAASEALGQVHTRRVQLDEVLRLLEGHTNEAGTPILHIENELLERGDDAPAPTPVRDDQDRQATVKPRPLLEPGATEDETLARVEKAIRRAMALRVALFCVVDAIEQQIDHPHVDSVRESLKRTVSAVQEHLKRIDHAITPAVEDVTYARASIEGQAIAAEDDATPPPPSRPANNAHPDPLKRIEARLRRGIVLLGALSDVVNHSDFDDDGDETISDINKTLYQFDQDVGSLDSKLCDALTTIVHSEAYKESDRLTAELEAA